MLARGSDPNQAQVPTVPEPETWALLALVALLLLYAVPRAPAAGAFGNAACEPVARRPHSPLLRDSGGEG